MPNLHGAPTEQTTLALLSASNQRRPEPTIPDPHLSSKFQASTVQTSHTNGGLGLAYTKWLVI